jgi:tetratricopeptide (TPR) repeat protein
MRVRHFSVAILTLCLGLLTALNLCSAQQGAEGETRLAELSAQAQAAQQRGDYAAAAESYEELTRLRPEVGEIWANLGLMYQFMGDYPRADRDFLAALKKNARLYVPNLFLGLNRLRAHEPRAALPYLTLAESLNKGDEQAALGLGRAYKGVADPAKAAQWFERATQINPQDEEAWYEMGVSYLALQDDAVKQLKQQDPDGVYARTLVADAFVEQGRVNDAILIYERFRSQSHPPCLKSKLGLAYAQIGSDENAKQAFEDEIASGSGCLFANLGLARLALTQGNYGIVLRELHTVREREPKFLESYFQDLDGASCRRIEEGNPRIR